MGRDPHHYPDHLVVCRDSDFYPLKKPRAL